MQYTRHADEILKLNLAVDQLEYLNPEVCEYDKELGDKWGVVEVFSDFIKGYEDVLCKWYCSQ